MCDLSWWGWGAGIGGFFVLLFWVAVIVLVVWLITRFSRHGLDGSRGRKTPLDIVRERYARGEISREEFEQIKKDLSE